MRKYNYYGLKLLHVMNMRNRTILLFIKSFLIAGLLFIVVLDMYYHFQSRSQNVPLHFNCSPTPNKLVRDVYEPGHLIVNADLCPDLGRNMKMMILVISAPGNRDERMAIRQTWGYYSRQHNAGLGFVIGASKQPSLNTIIQTEQNKYGDLIQGHFEDSYYNLTLKMTSLLEWVDTYCSQVSLVLKVDDDMFMNIPLLYTIFEELPQAKRSIFGTLWYNSKVNRSPDSKYFISESEYKPETFPTFVIGPTCFIRQGAVKDLYREGLNAAYFRMDDVFYTGFIANCVGIPLFNIPRMYVFDRSISKDKCDVHDILSCKATPPINQFKLWAYLYERVKCKNTTLDKIFFPL